MTAAPPPNLRGSVALGFVPPEPRLAAVLSDEGFRLFFPLAALHAALWPFLWVVVAGYGLPGTTVIAPAVWHMHEMVFGAFGAALLGFLTTAIPEWTDTPRLKGRALWGLAALWAAARVAGLVGLDALTPLAALADIGWIAALVGYSLWIMRVKRSTSLLAFALWLAAFLGTEAAARFWMIAGDGFLAGEAVRTGGLVLLGLLGLSLARIGVSVTNLVLDPSEETSPFRPSPGRLNLAPGLVAIAVAARVAGAGEAVSAWLLIAAGAGLLDRVGEGFVGREGLRTEMLGLALPAALAGAGLVWLGAAGLGAPLTAGGGWHLALMGGLGLAVLMVLSVAGLRHAGGRFPLPGAVKAAMAVLLAGTGVRLLPEFGLIDPFAGHLGGAILWALAFGLWLRRYWPMLADPKTLGLHGGAC